jgi:hypothetical protein
MAEPTKLGRFDVLGPLSDMPGEVYSVIDPRDGRILTLHVLHVSELSSLEAVRRDLSALITEPIAGVVRVHEFDVHGDVAYVLTEPLQERYDVGELSPQGLRAALALVRAYCHSVVAVRARAITCLVVSPSGLWRTTGGPITLAEFRVERPKSEAATATGSAPSLDEVVYLAPERVLGMMAASPDAADVYAAGVLLYRLITRHRPFTGESSTDYLASVINDRREPLPAVAAAEERAVMTLLERALSADPGQRPEGVSRLSDELGRLGEAVPDAPSPAPATVPPRAPAAAPATIAVPEGPGAGPIFDENVQFTVYRPRRIAPDEWEPLLVFAHLAERRADAPDDPDPIAEVQRQAEAILGTTGHIHHSVDSSQAVPRDGQITFVPLAAGVEFDPPARSFRWVNAVHREEFLLRAGGVAAGTVIRGRISVYLGSIILAEVPLTLTVGTTGKAEASELAAQSARPYRKIFASYSHRDRAVVDEFAAYAKAVGDRYSLDVIDLRSGEAWEPAIEALIRDADVFQLFWSWNAIDSPYVQREWEYAMQLGRQSFVRPVYWDEPLPRRGSLPPQALLDLHFEPVRPRSVVPVSPPVVAPTPARRPPAAMPKSGAPRARSWRLYATAAAILLAVVMLPTFYLTRTSRSPADVPDPGAATPMTSLTVVVRNDDGQVRANADVELVEVASRRVVGVARTDESGRAVFDNIKAEIYDVRTRDTDIQTEKRVFVTSDPVVTDVVVPPAAAAPQ